MVTSLMYQAQLVSAMAPTGRPGIGEINMISFIRILVLCTIAGILLAAVFMTPGGVTAGAVKGFLVGTLIAWGEWHSKRKEASVSFTKSQRIPCNGAFFVNALNNETGSGSNDVIRGVR